MPKLYQGKRGGVYYKSKGRKVYVTNRFGNEEIPSHYLPNSLYNTEGYAINLNTVDLSKLNIISGKIINYFTENVKQPNSFIVKSMKPFDIAFPIIPKNYDNNPVLIFDLDKTIDDKSVSPLFFNLIEKYPQHLYVVTARPDYYLDFTYKYDDFIYNISKKEDFKAILHNNTKKVGEKGVKWSNVYCRNRIFQYIAEKLFYALYSEDHPTEEREGLIHGLVKMIQLLHIKSSIGCKWKDMYFFDDSPYNMNAWYKLCNIEKDREDRLSNLNFIGGTDKAVFNENNQTYLDICCKYKDVFGDLNDCFVYADNYYNNA